MRTTLVVEVDVVAEFAFRSIYKDFAALQEEEKAREGARKAGLFAFRSCPSVK